MIKLFCSVFVVTLLFFLLISRRSCVGKIRGGEGVLMRSRKVVARNLSLQESGKRDISFYVNVVLEG